MDQQTNQQEPSSKEGGQVKVGDKAWVLCEVLQVDRDHVRLLQSTHAPGSSSNVFWSAQKHCRPEAEMIDGTELVAKYNKGIEVQGE
jgi:hypothetical protein